MSRGPDVGTLLVRALYRDAGRAGCALSIEESDWVGWASTTFSGARHAMRWSALPSPALDRWLAGLADTELDIRGHLVADITVAGVARSADAVSLEIEALTLAQ